MVEKRFLYVININIKIINYEKPKKYFIKNKKKYFFNLGNNGLYKDIFLKTVNKNYFIKNKIILKKYRGKNYGKNSKKPNPIIIRVPKGSKIFFSVITEKKINIKIKLKKNYLIYNKINSFFLKKIVFLKKKKIIILNCHNFKNYFSFYRKIIFFYKLPILLI
ncbi:hypothetical protein [Candidatus Vidania fulgoroideorum]